MTFYAPAKLNIFLKVVGKRGAYHELFSRFVLFESLQDELSVVDKKSDEEFELSGDFSCEKEKNTITKAYNLLKKQGFENELKEFFANKAIAVKKSIPEFAGLGGGSSDGACFLRLCNELLGLNIAKDKLALISADIGADLPFFVSGYKSANVRGIGEKVEPFEDDLPCIELKTPDVRCSTAEVFKNFKFTKIKEPKEWENRSSKDLLENFASMELNDLFKSAIELYPALQSYHDAGFFMSGSGSSMFKVKNG